MSFEIAMSGIGAVTTSLETISNNIANSGTYGFKSSRANFVSMVAGNTPNGASVGSISQSIDKNGGVLNTGRDMDAAIQGRGFFAARDTNGEMVYSRVGIMNVDKDGFVVDTAGRRVQGYKTFTDSAGRPVPGAARGALGDLLVPNGQIAAQATANLKFVNNMSADWRTIDNVSPAPVGKPFSVSDPQSFNSSITSVAYDSRGERHTLTQYFIRTGPTAVEVRYALDGKEVAGQQTQLSFDAKGNINGVGLNAAPTAPPATWLPGDPVPTADIPLGFPLDPLGVPTGAETMKIEIDYTGGTQYAGEATTLANNSDGLAAGTLMGTQISENGDIIAQYSNGQKQTIGTLALANFANENALVAVSGGSWVVSEGSGAALFATPGTGMTAKLTVAAIEQSNVDMTGELVNLMSAQRNYQANTKVITAEVEMMQALMQAV
ncbi:flagellar hook-basal body complex protein [Roseateles violae]|uniref:Flagellar hook protein FlgE n=1 Tax=Roseateles violae TaxID=3058042 RepID=A0ABT8DXL1_9BURK|nr:flagellar hook-basal body complex protein [Pelomonas sp. PFR6]MDN3921554.1 flagellar hook-basal body complex protein [Pelomonas sp. PFR6]